MEFEQFEKPLSLEQTRHHPLVLRGGNSISQATLFRWIFRGIRGVKLESQMRGGRRVVFPSGIERFHAEITRRSGTTPTQIPSSIEQSKGAATLQRLARKRPRKTGVAGV